MTTGIPEPRNEEESVVSYRLTQLERAVGEVKILVENSNIAVLTYKVTQLEQWRNKILGAVGAMALIIIGALISGDINFGRS